eukprot:scaffold1651_cov317-Pinguiococcus_pyrenoidosus.AAC.15
MGLHESGVRLGQTKELEFKGFESLSKDLDSLLETVPQSPVSAATDTSPDEDAVDDLSLTPEAVEAWPELDLDTFRSERARTHSFDTYGLSGVDDLNLTEEQMNMDRPGDDHSHHDVLPSPVALEGLDINDVMLPAMMSLDFSDVKRSISGCSNLSIPSFSSALSSPVLDKGRSNRSGSASSKGTVLKMAKAFAPSILKKPTSMPAPPMAKAVKVEKPEIRSSHSVREAAEGGPKLIGIYTPEQRKARIARFHAKRAKRVWRKRIKYDCRKKLADSRPRIKGRFVRREDMDVLMSKKKGAGGDSKAQSGVSKGGANASGNYSEGRSGRNWRVGSKRGCRLTGGWGGRFHEASGSRGAV